MEDGHPLASEAVPSETLGGLGDCCSPLEMANAYATIASGGMRNRPTAITKVTFPDGHSELPDRWKVRRTRAFDDGVAAKAIDILEENIASGTGGSAATGCPAGGKTGTTDNFTDAWFVGFTPRLATSVWVGTPSQQGADARPASHRQRRRRHVPRGDLGHVHEGRPSASSAATSSRPRRRSRAQPFFGEYASGTKRSESSGSGETGSGAGLAPVAPAAPAAPDEEAAPEEEEDTGDAEQPDTGGGDEGFDPEKYEAPPQEPPATAAANGNGEGGGTQAPG